MVATDLEEQRWMIARGGRSRMLYVDEKGRVRRDRQRERGKIQISCVCDTVRMTVSGETTPLPLGD